MINGRRYLRSRRGGFTLVEMLIALVAIAACTATGTVLIVTSIQTDRTSAGASEQVTRRQELGREFRGDVSAARSSPRQIGDIVASPTQLLLQMPGDRIVVYRWNKDNLERLERQGGKESRRLLPAGPAGTAMEFKRPDSGKGLVTLVLKTPAANGNVKAVEIAAATGEANR